MTADKFDTKDNTNSKAGGTGNSPAGKQPAKKKIIIVTGSGNGKGNRQGSSRRRGSYSTGSGSGSGSGYGSGNGRKRSGGRRDNRNSGTGRSSAPVRHQIKPKTVPSQMEVDFHKPEDLAPKKKPETAPAAETAAKKEVPAETAAAVETVSKNTVPAAEKAAEKAPEKGSGETAAVKTEEKATAKEGERAAAEKASPEETSTGRASSDNTHADARGNRNARDGHGNRSGKDNARAGQEKRSGRDGARADRNAGSSRDRNKDNGHGGSGRGDRGSNRRGDQTQGGRGRDGSHGGGGRFQQGDRTGGRPAAGQGRGGRAFGEHRGSENASRGGGSSFSGKNGKHDNGRKQYQDKRSRKDRIYQEEKEKNRPGRFIKPEKKQEAPEEEQIKVITIPEKITIRDLAEKMHIQPSVIIKDLFLKGEVMTPNSEVDYEKAEAIALEKDILCEKEEKVDVIQELLKEDEDDESQMVPRPPVICVMGHVDHGKTSILDAIRNSHVTSKEAGGITQAIGAYTVEVHGRSITFLDTPGHEAFTAMRMRGAESTDIAILVVAADDGVMPQTVEAINHAKAAGVEIIVAVNKMDKPEANLDRVKQELTKYELIPTDWGGSTEFVPVSAKTGQGLDDLLETILLTADIMDLKANPNRNARGIVLEAKLDKGRGPVANVLVQKGTLHVGDFISAGASSGKVRAMIDDKGRRVKSAKPSQPVEVLGLSDVPGAGEIIIAHDDDKTAKHFAETYKAQHREELLEDTRMRMNLDDLFNQMQEGKLKEFNLIVKADVQGSVEALRANLLKLSNDEVVVHVIHSGVGAITESDVTLASASNAVIIGFNVRPDATAKNMAEHEGVDIRLYKVIYQAIDAVEAAMKGMLAPIYEESITGHAEVRQIFKASAVGNIAGSYVTDGVIKRDSLIRIRRGEEQIYEGQLASLKRFKDDVKEVKAGFECGLVFKDFDKMNVGDSIEAYEMVEVPRE